MKIVIDLQGAQTESGFRGIGRYTKSLTKGILTIGKEHEFFILLNGNLDKHIVELRKTFSKIIPRENIFTFAAPSELSGEASGELWKARIAQKMREHFISQLEPDVVLICSMFEGFVDNGITSIGVLDNRTPVVTICYDFIPAMNPKQYLRSFEMKRFYESKLSFLKKSNLILAISDYVKSEANKIFGFSDDRVFNISAAVDGRFKEIYLTEIEKRSLKGSLGIFREVVLYAPGGHDVRKNTKRLVAAFAKLPEGVRKAHQLVVVSKGGNPDEIQKLYIDNKLAPDELVFTGYVTDDVLLKLYNITKLFVYPSLSEGFGLPVLEAMACGTPAIGSNCTSIPEVIGNEEALFDPYSEESICVTMQKFLSSPAALSRLKESGLRQATKFSWEKSAALALEAIKKVEKNENKKKVTSDELFASIRKEIPRFESSNMHMLHVAQGINYNLGVFRKKRLFLDISLLVKIDSKSGIQRVVRSILNELLNRAFAEFEVKPIFFDGHQYRYASTFLSTHFPHVNHDEDEDIVTFRDRDLYLALDLNADIDHLIHGIHTDMRILGVTMCYIVYDLLPAKHPEWWPEGTGDMFKRWLLSLSNVGDKLLCISQAVADELTEWVYENNRKSIENVEILSFHLGADVENSLPTKGLTVNAESTLSEIRKRVSFLMVGTLEPRKGHAQVINAFNELWESGCEINLVIVGKYGWLIDELVEKINGHNELNQRLFWLQGISDEFLEKVYSSCHCLIAASEAEGFGLPLIEAAMKGLPIICRDIPVFKEVAGSNAFFFSGVSGGALARAISVWLNDFKDGRHPRSDDIKWLTWRQSADQLLKQILNH